MAYDDDLLGAAEQQMRTLQAARARIQADLAEARAYGDPAVIGQEIQALANVDQQVQALSNLADRHARSQNPPAPLPQTAEEWRVKSADKMTWDDAYHVAAKSKHGVDMDAFKAGIAEVQRRRSRGE